MFRLHKQKSDKLGERFDFKLSNLQALQVPKGWDKLSISIVSAETGKAVAKSAKAPVWNGSCQWLESFRESVWLPIYDASKDIEGCLFKFVVFMGSSRSGMLGEATINLATFMNSKASFPLSLPLKKCSHGTSLQMKVQCLNPRMTVSDSPGRDMISSVEEANIDYDDIENKSDVSDNLSRMSSGSASSNHTDAQFHPVVSVSRETSFSASGSHYSFDSGEGSSGRGTFSPQRNLNGATTSHIARQDSASSNTSFGYDSPARSNKPLSSKTSRSRNSFQNEDSHRASRTFMGSPLRSLGTSKELIEAVEVTVEEVRGDARMWEKNAKKVMMDLKNLQKKFSDELEQKEALESELSASKMECDRLRWEIGELKVALEEMNSKQNAKNDIGNLQKQLEEEIKFLNESNTNLSIQLQKTQESNIELVSVLQEMEETIEKQRKEIADLLEVKSEDKQGHEESLDWEMKLHEPSNGIVRNIGEESISERNLVLEVESLKLKVQELERDCHELTDENLRLLFKLKDSQNHQVWDAGSGALVKENLEDELSGPQKTELELRVCDLEKELFTKNGECSSLREKCTELKVQVQAFRDEVSQLDAEVRKSPAQTDDWENRFAELEEQLENYKTQRKIQEIEETIEKQRKETANHLAVKSDDKQEHEESHGRETKLCEPLNSMAMNSDEESVSERNLVLETKSLKLKVQELERDCNELTDENLQLLFKLKELQNLRVWDACSNASVKESLEDEVSGPRKTELELRICDLENELSTKNGECLSLGEKCTGLEVQLLTFRDKVSQLDAEVHKSRAETDEWEIRFAELKQQLEDYKTQITIPLVDGAKFNSSSEDLEMMKGTYFVTQNDQHEAILNKLIDIRRLVDREDCTKEITVGALEENTILTLDEQVRILHSTLESKLRDLSRELLDKASEIDKIKAENALNQEEVHVLRDRERELDMLVSKIEEEKSQLVLTNKDLKRKSSELELDQGSLEAHLSELEKENVSLSERICGLEAQLRYLTDEKETSRLALQSSESHCLKLQEDESGLEAQKVDLRGKLSEMQRQLFEIKEECGYLRFANQKLEATAESVIEECSLLQKSNARLKAENMELNGNLTVLQAEFNEVKSTFDQLFAEIELLREKYDSVLEETALKERAINAELDALLLENKRINPSQREISFSISGSSFENKLCTESDAKILELMGELSVFKQNQGILNADREKLLRQLENFKSNEAKMKNHVRRLELKLKRFEYERTHLVEDLSTLRDQLQKIELLQIEVLNLRRALEEAKLENERLEASFQVLLGDYEETKSERDLFTEKISRMESTARELEVFRDRKVALEERVLRLEGDLTAREAIYAEDAELKNELARVRRANSQLQRRVEEQHRRAQALEETLKQTNGTTCSVPEEPELMMLPRGESHTDLQQRENADGVEENSLLKIQLLENQLAEALESNSMYKEQLKSLLSNGAANRSGSCERPLHEEIRARESVSSEKVSSLENELRELRESYLHMSLKYAQGEAEREEMAMRLKAR